MNHYLYTTTKTTIHKHKHRLTDKQQAQRKHHQRRNARQNDNYNNKNNNNKQLDYYNIISKKRAHIQLPYASWIQLIESDAPAEVAKATGGNATKTLQLTCASLLLSLKYKFWNKVTRLA